MEQPHAENLSSIEVVEGGSHLAWGKLGGEANNACIRRRKLFKMPVNYTSGRSNHLELLCLIAFGRLCKKSMKSTLSPSIFARGLCSSQILQRDT